MNNNDTWGWFVDIESCKNVDLDLDSNLYFDSNVDLDLVLEKDYMYSDSYSVLYSNLKDYETKDYETKDYETDTVSASNDDNVYELETTLITLVVSISSCILFVVGFNIWFCF
jgi:hypothetical protein